MRVLLAEDDLKLGKLIQYMLEQNQLATEWVKDGEQAYDYASYDEYDVIILDWMMPKMSGVEVCKKLRANGYQKAIMLLTARDAVEDRVAGLDAGADDYLVKPFEFDELMARLRALGRRSSQKIQLDVMERFPWIEPLKFCATRIALFSFPLENFRFLICWYRMWGLWCQEILFWIVSGDWNLRLAPTI